MALAAQGFADGRARSPPTGGRCARSSRASGCCRSTRSTCCSARTTCRSSAGSARTTPTLLDRAAHVRAAAAVRVLGPRGVAAAGRAAAAAALADGARAHDDAWGGMRRVAERAARSSSSAVLDDGRASAGRSPRASSRTSRSAARASGPVVGLVATSSARWSSCSGAGEVTSRAAARLRAPLRPARAGAAARPCSTTPDARRDEDAQRELLRIAARALGVATEPRPARLLPPARRPTRKPRVAELVEAGELLPVAVEGWGAAGLPATRARACRAASTRARCVGAVRLAGLGARRAPSGCSASATGSRSTCPRPSACTATTCCRSCSATGSSRASTSRPTAQAGAAARPGRARRARRARRRRPRRWRDELERMAGWLGLGGVSVVDRGDLAPALRPALASVA